MADRHIEWGFAGFLPDDVGSGFQGVFGNTKLSHQYARSCHLRADCAGADPRPSEIPQEWADGQRGGSMSVCPSRKALHAVSRFLRGERAAIRAVHGAVETPAAALSVPEHV